MPGKNPFPKKDLLISVIADESTVTGFLLTGMGQRDINGKSNYLMVTKETTNADLEKTFLEWLSRTDMGIIFIA